jgi:hypothetical protein
MQYKIVYKRKGKHSKAEIAGKKFLEWYMNRPEVAIELAQIILEIMMEEALWGKSHRAK